MIFGILSSIESRYQSLFTIPIPAFSYQSQVDVDSGIETMEVDEPEQRLDIKRKRVSLKIFIIRENNNLW